MKAPRRKHRIRSRPDGQRRSCSGLGGVQIPISGEETNLGFCCVVCSKETPNPVQKSDLLFFSSEVALREICANARRLLLIFRLASPRVKMVDDGVTRVRRADVRLLKMRNSEPTPRRDYLHGTLSNELSRRKRYLEMNDNKKHRRLDGLEEIPFQRIRSTLIGQDPLLLCVCRR